MDNKQFYDKAYKELLQLVHDYHYVYLYDFMEGCPGISIACDDNKKHLAYDNIKSPLERVFLVFLCEIDNFIYNIFNSDDDIILYYQYKLESYYIDFVIDTPKLKIAIEIDSFTYHDRNREQFDYERQRQNVIINKGFKLYRITYTEILNDFYYFYEQIDTDIKIANME